MKDAEPRLYERVDFAVNTPSPEGPGQYLNSAHVGQGHDIVRVGEFYFVRHKDWPCALEVHASATRGAFFLLDEKPAAKK